MRFRLRPDVLTLAVSLVACSVYTEDLLQDTASTSDGDTLTAGSDSTTDGSTTTRMTSSTGSGSGQTSSTSTSGSGGAGSTGEAGTGGDTTTESSTTASQGGDAGSSSPATTTGSGGSGGESTVTTTGASGSTSTGGSVSTDPLLIDDMEDGDNQVDPNYNGYWYLAVDDMEGSGSIDSPADPDEPEGEPTTPPRDGSDIAMHAAGSWSGWGAALGFSFRANESAIDGSAFSGISFYARADSGTVRVEVATEATAMASDHYKFDLPITSTWQHYEIAWTDLEPQDWSEDAPWEPESMLQVQFHFEDSEFDFWVDDIRFME